MTDRTLAIALACFLPLACADDGGSANTEEGATETDAGTGDGSDDGESSDSGSESGSDMTETSDATDASDDQAGSPPSIDSFTVNDSATPDPIAAASGVRITAEVSDIDEDISEVAFRIDGELVASFDTIAPSYDFEWVVSGAELNGAYAITAEAIDQDGNMAISEAIALTLAMPVSGEVAAWTHDGGTFAAVHGIAVNDDGLSLVATGQTTEGPQVLQRSDRLEGEAWAEPTVEGSIYGSAVAIRDDGGFMVMGTIPKPSGFMDSAIYHYDSEGALVGSASFDGSSQFNVDDFDHPIAVSTMAGGAWILGAYEASGGPIAGTTGSYVRRVDDALATVTTRWPSEELDGQPLAYALTGTGGGSFVLAGRKTVGTFQQPWFATFNAQGQAMDEYDVGQQEVEGGTLHAVATAADGSIVVAGQVAVGDDLRAWVRHVDLDGELIFEADFPSSLAVATAVAVDDFGEVVTVANENCTSENLRYTDCDLVIRKLAADGTLMWTEAYVDQAFLGPNRYVLGVGADLEIDRFGYIYVSALVDEVDSDWWVRKLHP